MIVLQRISDGAVFPYSKKTAGKAGFEVIDDPDRKPYESGKPRKIKPRRTAQRQAQDAIAREFQDFDDNALCGYVLEEYGVEFNPDDVRREDLINMIRDRRAAGAAATSAQDAPPPPSAPDAPPAPAIPGAVDPFAAMTKKQLADLSLTKYGYVIDPEKLTKEQIIAQLNQLEQDNKA